MKKALVALLVSGMMSSAFAGVVIEEGFDDVNSLQSKGWILENNSTPGGAIPGWFQGSTGFTSQNGGDYSYAASNYGVAGENGIINNWLYTPEFSTALGATVSFWLNAIAEDGFSDSFSFGYTGADGVLVSLMPAFTVSTGGWTQYTANIAAAAGMTRFAFQHTGAQATSNYVGLDTLSISAPDAAEVPEPASILILAAGAMGLVAARRRKRA